MQNTCNFLHVFNATETRLHSSLNCINRATLGPLKCPVGAKTFHTRSTECDTDTPCSPNKPWIVTMKLLSRDKDGPILNMQTTDRMAAMVINRGSRPISMYTGLMQLATVKPLTTDNVQLTERVLPLLPEPSVWSRSQSWSLSFEGDSDSGPYLSHLEFCVILLQSIWLLLQFILQLKLCLYTIVHLLLEEFKNFSQVILSRWKLIYIFRVISNAVMLARCFIATFVKCSWSFVLFTAL